MVSNNPIKNYNMYKEQLKYNLPVGWTIAPIEELIGANGLFVDGDWLESKDQNPKGKIRLIQLADIGDGIFRDKSNRFMNYEKALELNCTFLELDDILVARMPDPIGRAIIFPFKEKEKYVTVVDVAIIRVGKGIYNKYLMHIINSPKIRKKINLFQTGTTRKRISRSNLAKIEIPISPLNEQYRIVEKIEELFSEIEHIEKTLSDINNRLDVYWQSILDDTFNKINGKTTKYLSLLTTFIGAGSTPKGGRSIYVKNGIPFIRSQNVLHYSLNLDDIAYITDEINEKMSRTKIQANDVLLNITGASIGRCAYIPEHFNQGNVNQHVCIIRTSPDLSHKYLALYLNSPKVQRMIQELNSGATREALTLSQIKNILIPICSLKEQELIVAELESQYTMLKNVKETMIKESTQIEVLKQTVLYKAFAGELVSQNPDDEPAHKLLEKIKLERLELSQNKPKEKKIIIKIEKMERTKSVLDLLKDAKEPIPAKEVWQQSKHWDSIDNFYAELKSISELIEQTKLKTEILLSLKK